MIISQMNTERALQRVQLDLLDGESYQIRKIKKAARRVQLDLLDGESYQIRKIKKATSGTI